LASAQSGTELIELRVDQPSFGESWRRHCGARHHIFSFVPPPTVLAVQASKRFGAIRGNAEKGWPWSDSGPGASAGSGEDGFKLGGYYWLSLQRPT